MIPSVTVEPMTPSVPPAATIDPGRPEPAAVEAPPLPTVVPPQAPAPVAPPLAVHTEQEVPAVPPPAPRLAPPPAVVLPISRHPIRIETPWPSAPVGDTLAGLERLLRTASARGASTLYLSSDARPSVRVDGGLRSLDGEPVHTSNDVIALLLTLMPDRSHETLRTGTTTEWICDIEDVGRVRCMSFSDHRGPGGVFRLMPVRSVSADHLGLGREIQSLAIEPEGLVVIAGLRSSGKRTLISALVDLINRTRHDHVITIEREVNVVHDARSSFISQREVRGGDDEVLAAARAALREDPDVLVLEQIGTGPLMSLALEAAALGHLVIGGFSAHNATESIDRILDFYAPEHSRQVRLALADNLRGVVAQVLLPKTGGGRVAAREVLLNTPAVAGVIAEGKTSQLPMAIEGGRRLGMVPLDDALVNHVQSGVVDIRDAYRHATDRSAFLTLLKRQGVDTSAIERLA
jgi:twitching motility protein PilT